MGMFRFTHRTVGGHPCDSCGQKLPTEKIFCWRADHPDGESASFTSFTPLDLRQFLIEAADHVGFELRRKWNA
jgi:hypothetical protein